MISSAKDDEINSAYEKESWIISQLRRVKLHEMIDLLTKCDLNRFNHEKSNGKFNPFHNFSMETSRHFKIDCSTEFIAFFRNYFEK